ncbi:MAG: hypothetical protein COX19_16735 [Desulfobacterales bacterium CG23_combo_of_CG06-09_8_20_14_all_51_8]|nr:MAG: hypothetical protein COX19_16735 [Desulfobacterales bacterium CG23_combo_of_CG06-09_8_20_14_all_51_8]
MNRLSDPGQWDIWQGSASTGMLDAADRVDSFFGDERLDDENRYTRLRLGMGLGWHKNDGASLLTEVRLRLSLPQLKNRFQIVVDDSFEADEPDKGSVIAEAAKDSEPDAALRYILKHDERRRLTSDLGVRLSSPSQVFGRLRGRIILPFPIWELRLSQSAAWFTDDGVTETSELRWSRLLWTDWLFRAISRVTWEENNNGVTPAQSFSLFRELTTHRGYRLGASGEWPETPHAHEAKYTTEFTYRQLLHSRWLFLEITPGLEFPQQRDYECTPYINFKIEIVFDEDREKTP